MIAAKAATQTMNILTLVIWDKHKSYTLITKGRNYAALFMCTFLIRHAEDEDMRTHLTDLEK